jgi:hypothetical protein
MATKITRYSPDSCDCIIEYSWDDTEPETTRTHTLSTYVNKCSAHSILATDQDRWNAVFEENPRKNFALQNILDNSPTTALYDIVNGIRYLKNNIGFNFSFSGTAPNRVLTISFTGITLTTNQKNTIQTFLNSRFGVGKVIIQ